jgi:hypothetical protein
MLITITPEVDVTVVATTLIEDAGENQTTKNAYKGLEIDVLCWW